MAKLTCSYVKKIIPKTYSGMVFKSGHNVLIDLYVVKDELVDKIKKRLSTYGITMFREDFVHCPDIYTLDYHF